MAIIRCKMCGGTLEISSETVGICEYCGTKQTLPKLSSDRKTSLCDRAGHFRRGNEFDKAMGIYEQILNEDPRDAEIYWSLVLCRYGIEYVEDPATHKHIPTVNRAQFTSIFDDDNYRSALQYADMSQRVLYEAEAKAINEIQKGILAISQREKPFDVFICYKETDKNGRRTPDSVLATELYHQLTQEGFKVFFSRITLEDKLGVAYEPYIFAALNSAKVMVVIGTKQEYFNAVWVKNEWSRYLALIKNGEKKILIPAYRDMDPYDLPDEFSHLQAQDMSKLGFMQDLIRGIKKIAQVEAPKQAVVVQTAPNANIAPLLQRAFMFLEDGDWQSADEYCEKVLDMEPQNAQAYLGKLMVQLHVRVPEDLKNCSKPFDDNNHYRKVLRFADDNLRDTITGYVDAIHERNEIRRREEARQEAIYRDAVQLMGSAKLEYLQEAAAKFETIAGWKDSPAQLAACRKKIAELKAQLERQAQRAQKALEAQKAREELQAQKAQKALEAQKAREELQAQKAQKALEAQKAREELQAQKARKAQEAQEAQKAREERQAQKTQAREALRIQKAMSAQKAKEDLQEKKAQKAFEARLAKEEQQAKKAQKAQEAQMAREERQAKQRSKFPLIAAFAAIAVVAAAVLGTTLFKQDSQDQLEVHAPEQFAVWDTISVSTHHAMGVKSDGTVVTVGYAPYGQQKASSWTDIVAISAGTDHTVGLKSDGTVVAVGDRLDDNASGHCNVSTWTDIVAITAGNNCTAGLKSDGTVVTTELYSSISKWTDIVAISADNRQTFGLKSDGTVVATGDTNSTVSKWTDIVAISADNGQTFGLKSDGTVVATGDTNSTVSKWTDIVAISAGNAHVIGLKSDGTVVAAGSNHHGQCDVSDWTNIIAIHTGAYNSIGLKADGTIVAVGRNDYKQCTVSEWTDIMMPGEKDFSETSETVSTAEQNSPIVAISAGAYNSIGLRADGTVATTSDNASYLSSWKDIVSVSAGSWHDVGLKADGTVVAEGFNEFGQCDVSGWTDIVAISTGENHTVGLKTDGTVVAVGSNEYGQCNIANWKDIVSLAACYNHTVGLKADGTVVATGYDRWGQCSDVSGLKDIVAISAGYYHTVGLKKDGTVVAVGSEPWDHDVSGWTDIVAISASKTHTVGLKAGGTVVMAGTAAAVTGRNDVSDWTDIVAIATGDEHTVGLKADGTVLAVGNSGYGQCNISRLDRR